MRKEWKQTEGKHATGETFFVGRVRVGGWHHTIGIKSAPQRYTAQIFLPGIVFKGGKSPTQCKTPDEAKRAVESAVERWFEWINE